MGYEFALRSWAKEAERAVQAACLQCVGTLRPAGTPVLRSDNGLISYRGGTEYDNAFIIGNKDDAFMVIGKQARLQFAKLNQAARLDALEEVELSGDDIDFDVI